MKSVISKETAQNLTVAQGVKSPLEENFDEEATEFKSNIKEDLSMKLRQKEADLNNKTLF